MVRISLLFFMVSFVLFGACSKSKSPTAPLEGTYAISGTVTGVDSVTVTLSGNASATWTVEKSGESYTFTVATGGTYTITPSRSGYAFTPFDKTIKNLSANLTQNFDAKSYTYMLGITFVSIPGGTFQMGDFENKGDPDEKPVHTVKVSSFQMSEGEITNSQYCTYLNTALASEYILVTSSIVTGKKGSYSGMNYIYLSDIDDINNRSWIKYSNNVFSVVSSHENWPVVYVTWYGSKAFAEYYGWDLAREAEWEYACRGGKQYEYGTDDGIINKNKANYWNNGQNHPVNIKSYPKNPFGLYDMSGNVFEWCSDWYGSYSSSPAVNPIGEQSGSDRAVRGGGWTSFDFYCRSADRSKDYPYFRNYTLGFRVVRR
jgi:formylglycine-generating enzyme required for sulfatase activity